VLSAIHAANDNFFSGKEEEKGKEREERKGNSETIDHYTFISYEAR